MLLRSGIIGLYTALLLTNQGKANNITILAEYLPGDQSILYTSPWAGANFSSISPSDPNALGYDKQSYIHLTALFQKFGAAAGLQRMPITEYWAVTPPTQAKIESIRSYVEEFEIIPKEKLPKDTVFGLKYLTFNFYAPKFLVFLKDYLTAHGVTFVKRKLNHLDDAFAFDSTSTRVVFNCTGLNARSLPGVEDPLVYPTRGQIVVIKAPHVLENRSIWGPDFSTYIIPRPHSNGLVVLGGFQQKNNWTGDTFGHETASILDRTLELMPELLAESETELTVIREAAGLRPSRVGGPRIEREERVIGGEKKVVIHNYGASGTGYQAGLGMALKAISLLQNKDKAKL